MKIPLPTSLEPRDSSLTKDPRLVNVYVEGRHADGPILVKRPGITPSTTGLGSVAQGVYYWSGDGKVYTIFDDKLISYTPGSGSAGWVQL